MSNLSAYQIKYLKYFLEQKYVGYYDVQIELIDHLASAIEELIEEDPELNFELALDIVYKRFGVGGFAKIVKEKEKALGKFWRKQIWKTFLEFLRPPLLFIGLGLFTVIYTLQEVGNFVFLTGHSFLSLLTFLLAVSFCYKMYVREDDFERYLFLKSYYNNVGLILVILAYYVPTLVLDYSTFSFYEKFLPYMQVFSAAYLTLNAILIYILIFKIPRELLSKMKKQDLKYASH